MLAEQVTGIYAIKHLPSERVYIGSAINFSQRWREHRCLLNKGRHHSPHLQAAWTKYGEVEFSFKRMLLCKPADLLMYEQILIDGLKAFDRQYGFNAAPVAGSRAGTTHSAEAREKIRAARAKQVFSEETRAMWSANRTGRKMPKWFGEFTRKHRTGVKHTDEARAKISARNMGRKASLETREKKSKLTIAQVQEVRTLYATGSVTQSALAKQFSVDQSTVSNIVTGRRWATVVQPRKEMK